MSGNSAPIYGVRILWPNGADKPTAIAYDDPTDDE
jgi:hypothetical protein